jgi:hypothetical protein
MMDWFSRFAGRELDIEEAVFRSEHATGHRNRAIAYMMLNTGMLERDPEDVLDLYFRQCSISVDCRDMAVMAATLATQGVNPLTGDRVLVARECPRRPDRHEHLRHVRLCRPMGVRCRRAGQEWRLRRCYCSYSGPVGRRRLFAAARPGW